MHSQGQRGAVQLGKDLGTTSISYPLSFLPLPPPGTGLFSISEVKYIPQSEYQGWVYVTYRAYTTQVQSHTLPLPKDTAALQFVCFRWSKWSQMQGSSEHPFRFVYPAFGMVWVCGRCSSCLHYCLISCKSKIFCN